MSRSETIEWVIILAIVVALWPTWILGWGPIWVRYLAYAVMLTALVIITVRRWRRMKAGLEESEQMIRRQRGGDDIPGLPPQVGGRKDRDHLN